MRSTASRIEHRNGLVIRMTRAVRRPCASSVDVLVRRSCSYARNAGSIALSPDSSLPSVTASTIACAAPWPVWGNAGADNECGARHGSGRP
jgi:hypothetical protein